MRADQPQFLLAAGCTDLMLRMRDARVSGLINIFGLPELRTVRWTVEGPDSWVHIGACTTYADIIASTLIAERLPVLRACARQIGALQIQERGTVGGNIVTSSPVGDTLPMWLALNAELIVASVRGERTIAYSEFCTGYRQTALHDDELLVAVRVPCKSTVNPTAEDQRFFFWRKVGTRQAQAISKVSMAGFASVEEGRVVRLGVALGAVADRPFLFRAAHELSAGQVMNTALRERLRLHLLESIEPIDDVRSSARYRSDVAGNLLEHFLLQLSGH